MAFSPNIITLTDSGLVNFVQQIGSDLNILFSVKTTDYIGMKPGYLVFRNNWGDVFDVSINDVVEVSYGTTTTVYTQIGSAVNFAAGRGVSDKLRDIHTELTNNVFRTCCPMPTFVGDGVVFFANFAALPSPGQSGILYVTEDTSNAYWWDGSAYVALTDMQRYANFAAFPGTGLAGIFYVDESVPELYYWDGAAYQSLSGTGGGGNANITTITRAALQALIAGTSVSATTIYRITNAVGATKVIDVWGLSTSTISGDAINHTDSEFGVYDITGDTFVAQGDGVYIPLAGTSPGSPVTGTIEIDGSLIDIDIIKQFSSSLAGGHVALFFGDGTIALQGSDGSVTTELTVAPGVIGAASQSVGFQGITYGQDYSNNFTASSLVDKQYVDAQVVDTSITAKLDKRYVVVANATFTDPTPAEGKGFVVFVRNGTATVGGTGYSTAGTLIYRIYHSGAWANYTIGGGGGTPAGSDTQVQFNDGGSFGADSGLTFDKTDNILSVNEASDITVNGAAITSHVRVAGDDGLTQVEFEAHRHTTVAGAGASSLWVRSRGTELSPAIVQNGDRLLAITAAGFDGTDYATSAQIAVDVDGTPGSNDMPGVIIFSTSPDGSQTLTERMRINAAGNVIVANDLDASNVTVDDEAYGAGWNGSVEVPTKNALYDKIETLPQQDSMILANGQGAQTVAAASTTYAALFGGANTLNATESARQSIITNSGTISRFYLRTFTAQPGTGSLVLTIRNNAADTSVVITVAAGAAAGSFSDTSNTAAVVAGDLISVKCVNNAPATASAQILTISALFTR